MAGVRRVLGLEPLIRADNRTGHAPELALIVTAIVLQDQIQRTTFRSEVCILES